LLKADRETYLAKLEAKGMSKLFLRTCAIIWLSLFGALARAAEPLPVRSPDDPKLYYIGRVDHRDSAGPRIQWSNSTVILRFHGTDLQVRFTDGGSNRFAVVVDDKTQPVIKPTRGENLIDLATGLENADHTVEFIKRTEANQNASQIMEFRMNSGGELLEPKHMARKLEIIGDSISVGYGNEAANEKQRFSVETENGTMSYGAVAARALNAEFMCIAWSGRKMWPNNTVPSIYDLTLPTDTTSKWDFATWKPDAVLINLATNDFGRSAPDESGWTTAYEQFVKRVRKNYPDAMIYVATGSMMNGASLTTLKEYLAKILADLKTDGETRVKEIDFDPQDGAKDGLGADWHPSLKTDQKMAEKWESALEADLGWKVEEAK